MHPNRRLGGTWRIYRTQREREKVTLVSRAKVDVAVIDDAWNGPVSRQNQVYVIDSARDNLTWFLAVCQLGGVTPETNQMIRQESGKYWEIKSTSLTNENNLWELVCTEMPGTA